MTEYHLNNNNLVFLSSATARVALQLLPKYIVGSLNTFEALCDSIMGQ